MKLNDQVDLIPNGVQKLKVVYSQRWKLIFRVSSKWGTNSENKSLMFAEFSPHQHHSSQLSVFFV